jgi:hypothetical protein
MTELVTLKFRRGTTAEWTSTSSKLATGEPGFDTTTGNLKIGNGSSAWADLPTFQPGTSSSGTSISGGGSTATCDPEGNITLTAGANASLGNIYLDTTLSGGSIISLLSPDSSIITNNGEGYGGTGGVSVFYTGGTNGHLKIGGQAPSPNIGLYVTDNTLTFNGVAVGGATGGGSSITANGASVACDDPAGSGSITLTTTTANADLGNITLDASSDNSGYVYINSGEDVEVNAGSGLSITTGKTQSFFDNTTVGGYGAQISFRSSDPIYPGVLTVGGPPASTGLYVSNNQLLFNNATLGATGNTGPTGANGIPGATGADGVKLDLVPASAVLICDGGGNAIGSNDLTFSTDSGINLSTTVNTNRLVMIGYASAYYSDDYGDSWERCQGETPGYAAACSNSGIWIGANGNQVVTSDDGITWAEVFPLLGAPGNDNKYGIGFNGNACVVGTVGGNVAYSPDVTASPQVWSSPATQLTDVNISGVTWNPTTNKWWLFGSSSTSATVYTFDGVNTPAPLPLEDAEGNPIDAIFTDARNSDAWCMCGIQVGGSNLWAIGGKGFDQSSSLAVLSATSPALTTWTPLYEKTVTTGRNYLRCLATDGTYIYGGHTGLAIIRSPITSLDINSWSNYSRQYASWVDLTYTGGYWFAGIASNFSPGYCVAWSDTGIQWALLFVGPGIPTAYTLKASPGLIPTRGTVLASKFGPNRVGILTSNPHTTLDVRGTIASYTQYMNVGAADNGLSLTKINVADPVGSVPEGYRSAGVFSLDVPNNTVATIDVIGSFRLTTSAGGTYGILQVNTLGQLIFTSYSPAQVLLSGPTVLSTPP